MKLFIQGVPTGEDVSQGLIREAANFYTNILMAEDPDRIKQITVKISLIPNLEADFDGCVGFCMWQDDPLRPSSFLIELDADLQHKTMLISLAHEFVHVKQMAFGHKQVSLDGKRTRWMGQLIDCSNLHYYDRPWEVEAHGREYGLYDRFVNPCESTPALFVDVPLATTLNVGIRAA